MSLSEFYRSKAWEELIAVLKMERLDENGNLLCAYCGKPIVKKYDAIGHHKIYLTEDNVADYKISLNPDNIEFVHHACHNKIHEKGFGHERQVFIVFGSPLSGKSSFVNKAKQKGDLIVDVDSIWECVSGLKRYEKPNALKPIVFGIRDKLIEDIKFRKGFWKNAYLIGTYPYEIERLKLADMLGARLIHIDTSKEDCLKRLSTRSDGRMVDAWTEYINQYWDIVNGVW